MRFKNEALREREVYEWKLKGECMMENTHITWVCIITKQKESWSQSRCCTSEPPHYHLFYHFLTAEGNNEQREEKEWRDRGEKRIYIARGNQDCILLSCTVLYCVWLSNGKKNGTEKGWAGCWAIKAALCVAAGQLWWLSALANLVTKIHNHIFTQAQRVKYLHIKWQLSTVSDTKKDLDWGIQQTR